MGEAGGKHEGRKMDKNSSRASEGKADRGELGESRSDSGGGSEKRESLKSPMALSLSLSRSAGRENVACDDWVRRTGRGAMRMGWSFKVIVVGI
jgi:hypothetical protein